MSNGHEYEASLCQKLRSKYKINIEKASFSTASIPNYIILDSTRNIHSYVEFCKIEKEQLVSSHWDIKDQLRGVLSVIQTQYSQLDRPLFFMFPDENGVFYSIESSVVREHLLEERDPAITTFMINNSDKFQDVFPKIHKEL
ncbi:MAG: hypothetical protein J6W82_09910 [Bacteroidales bacterium]|nr:hypothetical protein [Bacteroidales bacterium]